MAHCNMASLIALSAAAVSFLSALTVAGLEPKSAAFKEFSSSKDGSTENFKRIAGDLAKAPDSSWGNAPLVYFAVPAMSSVKRLPDTYPADGKCLGSLQLFAARNEYEPASFVLYPFKNVDKLELKASSLRSSSGREISVSNIDLKVVKCWYQAGTAWYSYFADVDGRSLVPELLLNDENMIKVDTVRKDNYLRVDYPEGAQYMWMSYPEASMKKFNALTEPVSDAKTLMPSKLSRGEFKQYWVTVKVPQNAKEGLYSGTISVSADGIEIGKIPLQVKVLPFELPSPKTYYDMSRDFYVSAYHPFNYDHVLKLNGNDMESADRFIEGAMRNMLAHNLDSPFYINNAKMWKKVGMNAKAIFEIPIESNPFYGWVLASEDKRNPLDWDRWEKKTLKDIKDLRSEFGKDSELYVVGWDEPDLKTLKGLIKPWKLLNENGIKVMSTSHDMHWRYSAHVEEFSNYPGVARKDVADKWHAIGARVTTYAGPHMGPENPDLNRRNHGFLMYKRNQDGTCNYMLSELTDPWNEFFDNGYTYRRFVIIYPTSKGLIDTIGWEGFREGIDDVKYATLLKILASKAIASGNVDDVYAGRVALQWLEMQSEEKCDLNAVRLEMINYILNFRKYL